MTLAETLRTALGGVAANKLRSGLTILGMTIGVAAVIVLVAVGNGSQKSVQAGIDALGSNVLIVQGQSGAGGPGGFGGSGLTLTEKDAAALADRFNAPDVKSASPVVNAERHHARGRLHQLRALVVRGLDPLLPHGSRLQARERLGVQLERCQEAQALRGHRPDRRPESLRGPGSRRADGPRERRELPGDRRDQVQGLERDPGPGRRGSRPSPPCRTRSAATAT